MTKWWRRFDATATVAWLLMVPVAIVFQLLQSVSFVASISLYANVASHLAAWRADDNSDLIDRIDGLEQKVDRVLQLLEAA